MSFLHRAPSTVTQPMTDPTFSAYINIEPPDVETEATLRFDDGSAFKTTGRQRLDFFGIPAHKRRWQGHLAVTADGYQPQDVTVSVDQVNGGAMAGVGLLPIAPAIARPQPVRVVGRMLVLADGTPYPLRSMSFFLGLARYRLAEDIRPAIQYARDVVGATSLRTFVLEYFLSVGAGLPDLHASEALAALEGYLTLVGEEGMHVDLTAGDGQVLLSKTADQRAFFRDVAAICQRVPGVAVSLSLNEPWKNGFDPYASLDDVAGLLRARGSAEDENTPYRPPLELHAQHTERSLAEDGYKWARHQWEQWGSTDAPVYLEEPVGCAEFQIDGRRDNKPDAFAQGSVVGEFAGCGWCFHPEFGMNAVVPPAGSRQDACARAVGQARAWTRVEMQAYRRTRSGLSDAALKLDDDHALRVLMRLGPTRGQAVAVRPRGYVPEAINGWRIEAVSADGACIDLVR